MPRKPASPATVSAPAVADAAKPAAFIPGFIAKRDATVAILAYPFANVSDRDAAYLTSYGFAHYATGGGFTLADLYDISGVLTNNTAAKRRNPFAGPSIASAPATDAGAAERAIKRGTLTITGRTETGHAIYSLTDAGKADAAFAAASLAAREPELIASLKASFARFAFPAIEA